MKNSILSNFFYLFSLSQVTFNLYLLNYVPQNLIKIFYLPRERTSSYATTTM
jgi:hypothetical protein